MYICFVNSMLGGVVTSWLIQVIVQRASSSADAIDYKVYVSEVIY
jgi:hypothetical protein